MNTTCKLIACAALAAAPALFGARPAARLERDAPVTLRLKQTLSSETAHVNDRVEFEVTEDVSAGGTVVIAKGSSAWGIVSDAAPVGRLMRSGRLAVDIEAVTLADGRSVRLRAAHAAAKKPRETTSDSLGALSALPFTMFEYGKAIEIPAGKTVTAYTTAPVVLGSSPQAREAPAVALVAPSGDVLPSLDGAPPAAVERSPRPQAPAPAVSSSVLPGADAAPAERISQVSAPVRQPVYVTRGSSKKLLTILAVGVAAGLAGVLAAKGSGGGQTTTAPGATPTTVGIGGITVGGPH